MQRANTTLVNILLGLIIAVVAGLAAGAARGSTINAPAETDPAEEDAQHRGMAGSFAIDQAAPGSATIASTAIASTGCPPAGKAD